MSKPWSSIDVFVRSTANRRKWVKHPRTPEVGAMKFARSLAAAGTDVVAAIHRDAGVVEILRLWARR